MEEKQSINKNSIKIKNIIEKSNNSSDVTVFLEEKIIYLQEIIRNTIISIKKHKEYELFSNNDANLSISVLTDLYEKTVEVSKNLIVNNSKTNEKMVDNLQKIIDKLSMIICGFGTKNVEDLLFITFGSEFSCEGFIGKDTKTDADILKAKYNIVKKHIHPIGYKVFHWKSTKTERTEIVDNDICSNKIIEDTIIIEDANMYECFNIDKSSKSLYQKIYGIQVVIQNEKSKKTLVINGIIEDIQLECFTNKYIEKRKNDLKVTANLIEKRERDVLYRIIDSMTLKDILIYGNEDIKKKLIAVFTEVNYVKQTKLDIIIKKFLDMDLFSQRDMLINLLLLNDDNEIQYICYLLYDLITVNTNETSEDNNNALIYESLPWKIKTFFKDVVNYTIKYTNEMTQKYDINRISLEQQIYLLKVGETVKEKAMSKLKEIKGKPDESSTKAKQYLEGLIKIPFGIYREEPILKKMKETNKLFLKTTQIIEQLFPLIEFPKKEKYTSMEIVSISKKINNSINFNIFNLLKSLIENATNKKTMHQIIHYINGFKKLTKEKKIPLTLKNKEDLTKQITNYLIENKNNDSIICNLYDTVNISSPISVLKTKNELSLISTNVQQIGNSMKSIIDVLDESIHSHNHAKNQILKIIAQWMNGEQTGYCFGFEGSPGIGKTSLAKKGLSNCLKDEKGDSRPFSFIALGGSTGGNSLEGHGYTYLNSTWGKIVDILMETKCMNPIIYIDELDKVSKTENGKEIIGIFTHLIDSTQNNCFQDKYFSGIDIDLSKVLFIFSYNDPEQIDRVLLDRIHRIKFDNLLLEDKMVIVKKYILPEINKKMGFENIVSLSDDIIEHIIENYTSEPGVRKLKEILFDLFGEINLNNLKFFSEEEYELPIVITKENLETKYLIKYNKISEKIIHSNPEIGIINGLWANALGRGGIIPIQTLFYPSSIFLEFKLTGLQGDVMKESMNVAKTLAWNLTTDNIKKEWLIKFDQTKCQGLHIHCPEGSISKDGPSAGTAITIAIYSLLNKKLIKNDIAITGEISLNGEITAIGGLDIKITGGIKSGIKTFLFPKSNNKDYLEWEKNNKKNGKFDNIRFIEVSTIKEVLEHVFI